jgi:hypothetical protein
MDALPWHWTSLDSDMVKERAKACVGKTPAEIDVATLFEGWDVRFISGPKKDLFIGGTVDLIVNPATNRIVAFQVMG